MCDLIEELKELLSQEPDLELAILYGSTALNKSRPDSDIDIAILQRHPMDIHRRMELTARLGNALKRPIDLVDLSALNGTILKQVLTTGQVIVDSSKGALEQQISRMIYNQTDMMPYVTRTLKERQLRFIHG